ncbi:CoA-binding protein [Noviherbaspirillum autotrophicum]|uniref:CoA-binding protein n=1 Tax=Noviherbaspirillum autotrophicum TaxID=709839 RepID=A0A0C1YMT7_9BURK|nr:CoA-binding protein [Noviherbaspirillum autotrophicum]KIF81842.1 CoA-binding protein [Noviherbaspirillum autotrophicum]
MMLDADAIRALLTESHTIAVVGLSTKPERPSYDVAKYLQLHGYRIVPVNPMHAGEHILGEYCHATLTQAAAALKSAGARIDIVDCFRKSEHVAPVVDEAIAVGARCVWMQLGVIDHDAAAKAQGAGLIVVMDKCIKIEHAFVTR